MRITRRRLAGFLSAFVALCMLAACGREEPRDESSSDASALDGEPPVVEVPQAVLERARAAASALSGELQTELFAALEAGGPLLAVEVCSVEAQEISRAHSGDDLSVRRVSERTRNPLNRPDPYEEARLRILAATHDRGELPAEETDVVIEDGTATLRLMRPIVIAEPCLACHGSPENISTPVLELIRERYPEDRALGYAAGDLRGAVSVRVLLSPSEPNR